MHFSVLFSLLYDTVHCIVPCDVVMESEAFEEWIELRCVVGG